jgi:hypothetical protein
LLNKCFNFLLILLMSFQMAGFSTLAHSVLTLSKIYILDSSENQLNIDIGKNAAIKAGNDITLTAGINTDKYSKQLSIL